MKHTKDDDLGYAINHAIDELQNIVKNLSKGADNAELTKTMNDCDTVMFSLSDVMDKIDKEIRKEEHEKPMNLENMVANFFTKVRREA